MESIISLFRGFVFWEMEMNYKKALWVVIMLFVALFSLYSIIYERAWFKIYGEHGYDLEVFSESLESTLTGRGFFFNTKEWQDLGAWSHFGTHNSPILFFLLIPYTVFPSVYTLLVIQALAVGMSSWILFNLGKEVLKDEKKAFMISVAYLLNPLTHGIIRYEFHPCVLGVPFMFLFAYYMAKNDTKKAFIAALLVLSVKEDAGLFFIAYGTFRILKGGGFNIRGWLKEKEIVGFGVLGVAWILISVLVIIPHFNAMHQYPYFREAYFNGNFSRWTIFNIALAKLSILFLSTAFILLRKYEYWIPLIPLWMENAVSGRLSQAVLGFHYDYQLIAMTFIILVYALRGWKKHINWLLAFSIGVMLIFSPIFGVLNMFPLVPRDHFWNILKIVRRW